MPDINRIAGIILAAGGSTRMGQPKQLLPYDGSTLLRRSVESAIAAELSPITVVIPHDAAPEMRQQIENLLVLIAPNPLWRNGMGTSVKAGMQALAPFGNLRGVALMLCDQPLVTAPVLRRLIETFSRVGSGLVAAGYQQTLGVPAVFGPEYFADLRSLPDAQGAKMLIERNRVLVKELLVPEAATDIDDPAAYRNLIGVMPLKNPARPQSQISPPPIGLRNRPR